MKKLIVAMLSVLVFAGTNVKAEDLDVGNILAKIDWRQGVGYDFVNNEYNYLNLVEILNWRDWNIEVGYSSTDSIVGCLSYDLIALENYNINLPLLKYINLKPMVYAGASRIALKETGGNNEFVGGVGVSIIDIKF